MNSCIWSVFNVGKSKKNRSPLRGAMQPYNQQLASSSWAYCIKMGAPRSLRFFADKHGTPDLGRCLVNKPPQEWLCNR